MLPESHEDRLKRLGRDWFADVRRDNPDPPPARRREKADGLDGEGPSALSDWLFGGSEDAGSDD